MTHAVDVKVFFNFRSPYCYIASKILFGVFDDFHANLVWRPLPGGVGRSNPERAKVTMPVARQDMRRFARRLGIPVNTPPITTDPTRAAAISLLAEERGLLRPWVIEAMRAVWGEGRDIGQPDVLRDVCSAAGLDADAAMLAADDAKRRAVLDGYADDARAAGAFGVPTCIVGEEIFWGQDRIDLLRDHLRELRLARL